MVAPLGIEGVNLVGTRLGAKLKKMFVANEAEEMYSLTRVFSWNSVQGTSPTYWMTDLFFTWNLQQAFQTNRFSSAQSIWVDNSQNGLQVVITTELGISIVVPAWTSGMYPLICQVTNPLLTITCNARVSNIYVPGAQYFAGVTRLVIFNLEHPPFVIKAEPQAINPIGVNGSTVFLDSTALGITAQSTLYTHIAGGVPCYRNLTGLITVNNNSGTTLSNLLSLSFYDFNPTTQWGTPLFTCSGSPYFTISNFDLIGTWFQPISIPNFTSQTFTYNIVPTDMPSKYAAYRVPATNLPSYPGISIGFNSYVPPSGVSIYARVNGIVGDYRVSR